MDETEAAVIDNRLCTPWMILQVRYENWESWAVQRGEQVEGVDSGLEED